MISSITQYKTTGRKLFKPERPIMLESGDSISAPEIAFHTYGELNIDHSNVVWVCHALTGNSDPFEWWPGLFGKGRLYDPENYFIVCANVIGSCYGSTGPLSNDPKLGGPWYQNFPRVTIRDMVNTHELLREHLQIEHFHTLIGGSLGGFQAVEWCIINPDIARFLILIGCNEQSKPWMIAFNESQRMAIKSDCTFFLNIPEGGSAGLKAARSIAMLSYRTPYLYNSKQAGVRTDVYHSYNASSYQQYQGLKLVKRFNAYSYITLTHAMDSHNVSRNRSYQIHPLQAIHAKTLCIGIKDDLLFPPSEVRSMSERITNADYIELETVFGHDGFLIETDKLQNIISEFYKSKK